MLDKSTHREKIDRSTGGMKTSPKGEQDMMIAMRGLKRNITSTKCLKSATVCGANRNGLSDICREKGLILYNVMSASGVKECIEQSSK